jgi:uncharacterized damage-inducible protein DinB
MKVSALAKPRHARRLPHNSRVANSNSSRLQRCETQLQDFLDAVLNGLPADVLGEKPASGKWSVHEQLAHLARYHQIFLQRVDRILAEQVPEFSRYRAEEDAEWKTWTSLTTQQVLVQISSMRTKLMARLHSLSEKDFARTGIHSGGQKII